MRDILSIKKSLDGLGYEESKSYLGFILAEIQRLKEQAEPQESVVARLVELYDGLMEFQDKKAFWDPAPTSTHVHIVIGDSFAGSMKHALKGLGWSDTHKVITLWENYAIGPLGNLDSPEGRKARSDWFRDHITEALETYTEYEEEYGELLNKLAQIPEQAKVIVWADNNGCEQTGMRYAFHLLRGRRNSFAVYDACAICEKLFNRPNARIDYVHSGEIPSDKLKEALLRMEGSGLLSSADVLLLAMEWQAISEQTQTLRIWQEGAVIGVSEDYYDAYLLEKLDKLKPPAGNDGFLKAARLIGEAIGYCDQYIGDAYFEYRLRELIYNGSLEIKGVPAAMRHYSIRRKQAGNKS